MQAEISRDWGRLILHVMEDPASLMGARLYPGPRGNTHGVFLSSTVA